MNRWLTRILTFFPLFWCLAGPAQESDLIRSLKRDLAYSTTDTATVRLLHDLAREYTKPASFNQDSALLYVGQAQGLSASLEGRHMLYGINLQYARILEMTGNYSLAMEYLFNNLELLDSGTINGGDTVQTAKMRLVLYGSIANDYTGLGNYAKAFEYYRKVRTLLEALHDQYDPEEYYGKMQIIANNIGSAFLSDRQFDSALVYLREVAGLDPDTLNPVNLAAALNNIGIIFKERREYDSAFAYYQRALKIRQDLGDARGIAQIYNNLGDYYLLRKDYPKAIRVLTDALEMSRRTGALQSQMKAANFLSEAYASAGNYSQALEMQKLFKVLNDSIINIDNIKRTTQLELQYLFDKKRKVTELEQQKALARRERNTLIMAITAGTMFFGLVILLLLYYLQRNKARRSELELDFRNKELTTHVMYLLQKNELILSVSRKLLSIKDKLAEEDRKELVEIVRELQSGADKTVWEEFEIRFQNVHRDFYENLHRAFPELTPNEKKLSAFLRLNMTTKEISSITSQSTKSILVARTRLRKKLGIDRDENLVSFLQQF